MRTDSIFYKIFQTLPETLFAFIGERLELAKEYEFKAIEVKELAFRIDGVFISEKLENPIYFLEVQFQKDPSFYWRFFGEIFMYFKQYQPVQDWQAVVIFPKRSIEPDFPRQLRGLLPHLHRIYLDELTIDPNNAIGINIAELVIIQENKAIELAKQLITQTRTQSNDSVFQTLVLELIKAVLIYKLGKDKEKELKTMFTREDLRNSWLVQEFAEEAKAQGKQEGLEEGEQKGKAEGVRQVATNLLKIGISAEQVSIATGLTISEIQQL
jgi:predicted transposase/invertase (TIGR01784 family)